MKSTLVSVYLIAVMPFSSNTYRENKPEVNSRFITENVFIITTDGFRWQEIFNGADSSLLNNERYTPDAGTIKLLYWDSSPQERRKKLMPFFWNVISTQGQLHGNRFYKNKVNVANAYTISYPGYNEIFTGNTDISISSNAKGTNTNVNILEYLNKKDSFKGKVVAFTSWDVFPYILNENRSGLLINSGYENINEAKPTPEQTLINRVQDEGIYDKTATRYDQLTFLTAKEYIQQHRPRVVYLSLGETDEFAHQGRYDLYLNQANQVDKMIAELWHWVQTTAGYKDNTTFIITTDHGRGSNNKRWPSHGEFIKGSSQTWLAIIGPQILPLGEIKEEEQLYQQQIAQTVASLLGEEFKADNIAPAISLKQVSIDH
jgi:Type I phosphodiesterase / nucleotide pyrophosphatase